MSEIQLHFQETHALTHLYSASTWDAFLTKVITVKEVSEPLTKRAVLVKLKTKQDKQKDSYRIKIWNQLIYTVKYNKIKF